MKPWWPTLWLVGLLAAATAACGPVPQPFRHDDGEVGQLARPKLGRGLALRIADGVPQADALTTQLLKSFDELEIPLSLRDGPGFGRQLSVDAEAGQVIWRLRDGDGRDLARLPRPSPAGAAAASAQAAEIAAQVASHLDDPDAKGTQPRRAAAKAVRPRVRIEPLRGLPGNGDQALAAALATALSRRGVDIAENAPVTIVGQVAVAPPRPGSAIDARDADQDILQVAWLVKAGDAAGRQLARLDQSGPVPKGRLSQPWGALAGDIAEGSALDLAKVVRLAAEALAESPPPPDAPPPAPAPAPQPAPPSLSQQAQPPKAFTETGPADIGGPNSKDPAITAPSGPRAVTAPRPPSGKAGASVTARAATPAAKAKDMNTSKSSHQPPRKPQPGQRPASTPQTKDPSLPSSRSHPDR